MQDTGIRNISINPDWLYHQIYSETLDDIINDGAIKSRKELISQKEKLKDLEPVGFNGFSYVSVAKRVSEISTDSSCFNNFIFGQYALIIENCQAIKTIQCDNELLARIISIIPQPIRLSYWADEYQIKKEIKLDKIVGIKIPEKGINFTPRRNSYVSPERGIDLFLTVMEKHNYYLPFIDIEYAKEIKVDSIKEYILEREKIN